MFNSSLREFLSVALKPNPILPLQLMPKTSYIQNEHTISGVGWDQEALERKWELFTLSAPRWVSLDLCQLSSWHKFKERKGTGKFKIEGYGTPSPLDPLPHTASHFQLQQKGETSKEVQKGNYYKLVCDLIKNLSVSANKSFSGTLSSTAL